MALRRIEIQDLPGGRPLPAGGLDITDVPPHLMDMPLEVFLGLRPGDRVTTDPGGPAVLRADGTREEITLG